MKKFTIQLNFILLCLFVISCNKAEVEPENFQDVSIVKKSGLLSDPACRQGLIDAFNSYPVQAAGSRNAEFIPVFFTQEFFGFIDDNNRYLASFYTEIDDDDFYRENPDGTVSVHIISEEAVSEVYDYQTYDLFFGFNGHMSMHYSGPVYEIPYYDSYGNLIVIINMVIPEQGSPASVWHGNGPVQLWGYGPELNLVAHLTASAAWKKINKNIRLN